MNTSPKYNLLTDNLFLLGLALLLSNDLYFKYHYSGLITGKLSDFAGLFIFPFFVSIFFPKYSLKINLVVAILFTFWKLEISQYFIDSISTFTNLGFHRTVDPSDLIALTILPLSYNYFKKSFNENKECNYKLSFLAGIVSVFSFCATTVPHQSIKSGVQINKVYKLPISKPDLFKKLTPQMSISDSIKSNLADTSFYVYFNIPDYDAEVTAIATIKSFSKDEVIIRLDSVKEYLFTASFFGSIQQSDIDACQNLNAVALDYCFKTYFIAHLEDSQSSNPLYFDNKELFDQQYRNEE